MRILPIVHRELRLVARKRGTFISRSVVAGIVILLWVTVSTSTGRYMSTAELARTLFWTYGILAMLYALLCGVLFTADALSAERRDGTLGLLFLTDLKGFDVVLGKLVATSWHGVFSLLVIVPILALPLLMGGVSQAEMVRLLALLLSTTFYSLSLGLLISTLCRRMVAVVAVTFLVLFLQCTLPWLVAILLDELAGLGAENDPVVFLCPFTSMVFLQDFSYQRGVGGVWLRHGAIAFWMPIILMWILGTGALGSACWLLPRVWRRDEEPVLKATSVPREPSSQKCAEAPAPASIPSMAPRRQWIEGDPYRWLAKRDRRINRVFAVILLALIGIWSVFLCLSFVNPLKDMGFSVVLFGAFSLHVMTKGWLALEASRRFCEDRQSGAMELLLVTPIPVEEVIQGELAAIKRAFAFPLLVTSGVNVALALVIAVFDPVDLSRARWWFAEVVVFGGIMLWLDARAIAYAGMLTGLTSKRHHRAVLGTLLRVLVPPWAGVVLFFLFVMLPGGLSEDGFLSAMHGWFFLCGVLDFGLISHAKSALRERFRPLCAGEPGGYAFPGHADPAIRALENP